MTIYDIAKEAGVSISTVSRVLNKPETVSLKTRRKVQGLVNKYGFVPNAVARGLVSNSTHTIGIMVSNIRDYQFAYYVTVLENISFDRGYSVILCNTGNESEKKKDYIRILAQKKVDGIILLGSAFTGIGIEAYIEKYLLNIPMVIANSTLSLNNLHNVLIDHDFGMDLAIRHLQEKGHKHIIYVMSSTTYNANRKLQGFYRALEKYRLPRDRRSEIHVPLGLEGAYTAIDEIFDSTNKFSAIVFSDDITGLGGLKRLKEKGISVPKDVAVLAYNNSMYSLFADPQLTSVDIKNELFATLVANMLYDLLRNIEVGSSVILKPDLIVRSST